MDETVLIYLERDGSYLMLYRNKRENDLNQGKYVGIGGHLEKGETKEAALIREVREETGLILRDFKYRGDLVFINDDYQEIMYLYTSDNFSGSLKECDEGELMWVKKDKLLSLNLWEGDRVFLPLLMNTDKFLKMKLIYSKDQLVQVIDESEE